MTLLVASPNHSTEIADVQFHWLKEAHDVADHTHDHEVVVDIAAIETISSDELSELIRLKSKMRNAGRSLVLENVQQHLWEVFTVTRLDRLLDLRRQQALETR